MFNKCVDVFTDVRLRLEHFLKPLKCSSGYVKCSFDNSAEIFHEKSEYFSLKVQK